MILINRWHIGLRSWHRWILFINTRSIVFGGNLTRWTINTASIMIIDLVSTTCCFSTFCISILGYLILRTSDTTLSVFGIDLISVANDGITYLTWSIWSIPFLACIACSVFHLNLLACNASIRTTDCIHILSSFVVWASPTFTGWGQYLSVVALNVFGTCGGWKEGYQNCRRNLHYLYNIKM